MSVRRTSATNNCGHEDRVNGAPCTSSALEAQQEGAIRRIASSCRHIDDCNMSKPFWIFLLFTVAPSQAFLLRFIAPLFELLNGDDDLQPNGEGCPASRRSGDCTTANIPCNYNELCLWRGEGIFGCQEQCNYQTVCSCGRSVPSSLERCRSRSSAGDPYYDSWEDCVREENVQGGLN